LTGDREGNNINMEKSLLKTVLAGIKKNEDVEIAFIGGKGGWNPLHPPKNKASYVPQGTSGTWKVVESKRGRGKNGSQILTLGHSLEQPLFQIGTSNNDEIVYIVSKGIKHGAANENDVEKIFPKNIEAAKALKTKLTPLLSLAEGVKLKLNIQSTEKQFNGQFDLLSAKALPGRWGQIKLDLRNVATGELVSLWSYRHATVVTYIQNANIKD
jgi:hypothetical protein